MNQKVRQQKSLADQHYNEAHQLQEDDQPLEAIAAYLRCLALNPKDVECLYNLGNACTAAGKHRDAGKYWRQALAIDAAYVPAHINLGQLCRSNGQLDGAVQHYLTALKHQEDCIEARVNLGVAYAMQRESALAVEQYRLALKLDPEYHIAHYNLALLYHSLGRTEEAIEGLRASLNGSDNDRHVHAQLGAMCVEVGDVIGAIQEFGQVLEIDPQHHETHMQLGLMLLERDKVYRCRCKVPCCAAIPHLQIAAEKAQNRVAYVTLAKNAESHKDWSTALGYWTSLIKLDQTLNSQPKERAVPYLHRGQCQRSLGFPEKAERDYKKCLELNPECNEARLNLGFLLASKGDQQGSQKHFLDAVQKDKLIDMGPLLSRQRTKNPFKKKR